MSSIPGAWKVSISCVLREGSWTKDKETGKDTAKVMDTVGGVMYVEYKNGEVRECQK